MWSDESIESMCRAVCKHRGIDPDGAGCGMGREMPVDSSYKLWEAQVGTVKTVLAMIDREGSNS